LVSFMFHRSCMRLFLAVILDWIFRRSASFTLSFIRSFFLLFFYADIAVQVVGFATLLKDLAAAMLFSFMA